MIQVLNTNDRMVQAAYMVDGIKVTICKPGSVSKAGGKTWKAVRGSVYTMGAKAASLGGSGINKRAHG